MPSISARNTKISIGAYQILKKMIMERQLLPGEKIPQEKLAEDLGISRTPLVNALKFLEKESLSSRSRGAVFSCARSPRKR